MQTTRQGIAPTVAELDATWPKVKERLDFTRELALDAAERHAEHPSDATLRELQDAVREHQAAAAAEWEAHQNMAAALRRERPWLPAPDRRATWEVTT